MTERDALPTDLPQATVVPPQRKGISAVWIIPLIAAVIAIGIAVERVLSEGPTIRIVFTSAAGVEEGKTYVRYKDVNIGQVTAVRLSEDFTSVIVEAKIDKHAERLMVEDAKFWVVEPRITLSGVSGLGTLISGNYIGFEPGSTTKPQREFTGLRTAPVILTDEPGRHFLVTADTLGSLGIGSPLYYRRVQAGQVTAYELAPDGETVQIRVFVRAPYDRFVRRETRFWEASGLDVSMGADGIDVRTQSLLAVLIGGIAFDTPSFAEAGDAAAADTTFALHANRAIAMKQPESIARRFVLYSDNSLRGLSVGAPVTLLGLPAGEVTDVGLDIDPATGSLRGRIELVARPERIVARLRDRQAAAGEAIVHSGPASRSFLQQMIEEGGLRAQLRSGNLLTGQLYVAFDFFPDAAEVEIDWSEEMPVLPLVASTLPDVEAKITKILAKVEQLPLEEVVGSVVETLSTLDQTLKDVDRAVVQVSEGLTPELKSAIAELRKALAAAEDMLNDTSATLVGENAPGQLELRNTLSEVSGAARSLRVLSDYLERHPEALLRGKGGARR